MLSPYIPHKTVTCDDRDTPWKVKISSNSSQIKIKPPNHIFGIINQSSSLTNLSFFKES